ncbi:hypothetical protein J7K97_06255 [Candidatus Aerophobetes bacterium]|nr:hypothetical protein [Candidatus Aerophobetes bacterium]
MRKVLIGVLIACLSLGLATVAFAGTEISTSGNIEFKVTGSSEAGAANGLFGAGDVLIDYNVTATSGNWKAVVSPEFDIGGGELGECDAYLQYSGGAFDLILDPTGIDNGIFDVECAADITLGIPSNPGVKLSVPMEGFDFYAVVNNQQDGSDVIYNFAGGVDFSMGPLGLGFTFNSNQKGVTKEDGTPLWDTASSYGAQVTYSADSLSFTGQYGGYSPEGGTGGSGYVAGIDYTLAGGSSFSLYYYGADADLNSADGTARTAYSKVEGSFSTPLAENVSLTLTVTSTDDGSGGESVTEWEGKIGFSV